jgi:hypothetical protein
MGYLEYDAIGVGEMELNYGLEKLLEDHQKYNLNLICANLVTKVGDKTDRTKGRKKQPRAEINSAGRKQTLQNTLNTVFPPYRIVERDGVKFGFVALLSPQTKIKTTRPKAGVGVVGEVEAVTYTIKDTGEYAGRVIPEVRDLCDVLVLLAHMDQFELESLLPDHPEIDIAVLGHDARNAPLIEPILMGTVPVYRATAQGQNIGNLKLTLDADKKIVDTNNKTYFLDDSYTADPEVAQMLDEFDEEYRKTQKLLFAREQLKASKSQGEASDVYLGLGACMDCHVEAFEVYTRTGHATTYRTLSSQYMQRAEECVGCHVTGYLEKGGFAGLRALGTQVDLIDVQCEACHGPGSEHDRDGNYRELAVQSCVQCHTKERDPDFDFAEAWPKIAH